MTFGNEYAAAYDVLYRDKDYNAECDLLERVFQQYGKDIRRVLDLGCGTGGHSALLADRGYTVTGVDRSAEMLQRARARGNRAQFQHGDVASVRLNETFDAVLLMFAVLGYQTENGAVGQTLKTARAHLREGGLLFADVWYGPAVLSERPSERVKVVKTPEGGDVIRVASSELDTLRDVCTVRYHLWHVGQGQSSDTREEHPMRYFFAPELQLFLSSAGFELLRFGEFPHIDTDPTERTWNVAFVARAV